MRSPHLQKILKQLDIVLAKGYGKLRRWGRKRMRIWKRIKRDDRLIGIALLVTWIALILGLTNVFPGNYIFEGYIIAKEVSFTYSGAGEKRFLNTIDGIQTLTIVGRTEQPIRLQGEFFSDDPQLNSQLTNRSELTIALPKPTSQIIFSANPETSSQLSLLELYLQSEIRIDRLTYDRDKNQLSFCLRSTDDPAGICLSPEGAMETEARSAIARTQLQFGEQTLNLTLADFQLPELGIDGDEVAIAYKPTRFLELEPALLSPAKVSIALSEIDPSQSTESSRWFHGDLDVRSVNFKHFNTGTNIADEIETSTIFKGQVRLKQEKINLEANQFFIVLSPNPGIHKLRDLQIHWHSPQGLLTQFSGKSQGIAAGLYPEFPVQQIQPNWLSYHFSTEAVSAILSFVAACTAFFLPRLFPPP